MTEDCSNAFKCIQKKITSEGLAPLLLGAPLLLSVPSRSNVPFQKLDANLENESVSDDLEVDGANLGA
jgi:hypothetical protein